MTELTHLLGFELTDSEKSLISFGESRGRRMERQSILNLIENEMKDCTCEDVLTHLAERIQMIKIKEKK